MDGFDPQLVAWALMASTLVKFAVDAVKLALDPPRWLPPTLALVLGIVFVLLIQLATEVPNTPATLSQAVIAGVLAMAFAVGLTELHKAARRETT